MILNGLFLDVFADFFEREVYFGVSDCEAEESEADGGQEAEFHDQSLAGVKDAQHHQRRRRRQAQSPRCSDP